jgi:integrase
MPGKTYRLYHVYVYPNEECNLACRHCWITAKLSPAVTSRKLTSEVYRRLVDEMIPPGLGLVAISGGEPLMSRDETLGLDSLQEHEELQNPTLDKYRRQMFLVYKHGQRYGLIPRTQEANPLNFVRQASTSDYEAITITADKTFEILQLMPQPERTLTLLIAATGLRISEGLGLRWADIDYDRKKIFVRRAWTRGEMGQPKSKASKAPVSAPCSSCCFSAGMANAICLCQAG